MTESQLRSTYDRTIVINRVKISQIMPLRITKSTVTLENKIKKNLNTISTKPYYSSQNVPLKYIQIEIYFPSKQ